MDGHFNISAEAIMIGTNQSTFFRGLGDTVNF